MNILEPQQTQAPSTRESGEWDQFTRQVAIVILMLGVLFLITVMRPLLNLLGITGIVILILSYPVNRLRSKTKLSYPVAVLLVFIPLAIILFILFGNLTSWVVTNFTSLVNSLNQQVDLNKQTLASLEQALGGTGELVNFFSSVTAYLFHQLRFVGMFVTYTCLSVFLAFLFILEMPANIQSSFRSMSDISQREFGILVDRLSAVWNGWLRSTVITSLIIGVSTGVELYLFGIPYAGILGVVTGFLNLVPTFGPFISYLLIIIVTYTQGSTRLDLNPATLTLLVWAVNLLINQVVRLVIFPKLAGKAVHLPVFFVILGLVVAAVLWGVIGVILVIPLLGTVREVLQYVLRKINRQDPYPGEEPQEGFWAREITAQ
jgi:predicted PurR-regulated permease PerM